MPAAPSDEPRATLLELLDTSYERQSWHGPNLKGSIRGLDAEGAGWRAALGRHSIAEIVVHAAYWKYTVRRRLLDQPRGSFALEGSNWFVLPEPLSETNWKECRTLLESEHRALRAAIVGLPGDCWRRKIKASKVTYMYTILGIAQHDVYHAGQIQMLKRLRSSKSGQ